MTPAVAERVLSLVIALGSGAVLAIAVWLTPDAAGHSTHTQLGLQQCTFLSFTGWPCPMCGATTTFSLMAHLRVLDGIANQPFAAALFVATVAVFAISAAEAVLPTRRWSRIYARVERWEGHLAIGFIFAMMLGWTYKIAMMSLA